MIPPEIIRDVQYQIQERVILSNRRLVVAITVSLLLASGCADKPAPVHVTERPTETVTVIDGAQVWDGTGLPPTQDAVLVMRGSRIEAVGPRGALRIPENALVIDAQGRTAIPGLINSHGHVGMTKGLRQGKENYTRQNILDQLRQYARYGVTTVMSLGTDFEPIFEVRGAARLDEPARARVYTAGRGFAGKQAFPAVLPGNAGLAREVGTAAEVSKHVEELADQKVDAVKVWVDDHWGHYSKIPLDLCEAIIKESHARNLTVMAHVFYLEDARKLVQAGLDGMAHSVRDKAVDEAFIKLVLERGVFVVPTLTREESTYLYAKPPAFLDDPFFGKWVNPEIIAELKDPAWGRKVSSDPEFHRYPGQLKTAQKNLKKVFDAGVKIAFGTDSGPPARFQGYFEHRELELMVQAGLTPSQALQTATGNAAACLKLKEVGRLEAGKQADIVLLDGDPLEDIVQTRQISRVWVAGREVDLR
ncbi:MAG: amidohydrolase family protein [Acidobacteriota bacterium]